MKEDVYKPWQFAQMLNVTVRTLQRWDYEGKLKAFRGSSGRRFYTHSQYLEIMGKEARDGGEASRISVIYTRVSTRNQKDDLENQVKFVTDFCAASGIIISREYSDFGSGLNYKRKKWNEMLADVMDGKIENIIIASRDRFVRFGFDWFENMCGRFGTKVITINNTSPDASSPAKELVQDIISILHVFSCRLYGLRRYKAKIARDFKDGNLQD